MGEEWWDGVTWGQGGEAQGRVWGALSSAFGLWLRPLPPAPLEGVAQVAQQADGQVRPEQQLQPQLEGDLRVSILAPGPQLHPCAALASLPRLSQGLWGAEGLREEELVATEALKGNLLLAPGRRTWWNRLGSGGGGGEMSLATQPSSLQMGWGAGHPLPVPGIPHHSSQGSACLK